MTLLKLTLTKEPALAIAAGLAIIAYGICVAALYFAHPRCFLRNRRIRRRRGRRKGWVRLG